MMTPAIQSPIANIVQVDRRGHCVSSSLATDAAQRLNDAFRKRSWWVDRWHNRKFRAAALNMLKAESPGGLAIIGPRMGFEIPPPFREFFEPIEFGVSDDQWNVLSGDAPTKQERITRVALWIFAILGIIALVPMVIVLMGSPLAFTRIGLPMGGMLIGVAIFTVAIVWATKLSMGRWFLLPGAVAIVPHSRRSGPRVVLLTRHEHVAVIRWVSNGKSSTLMLEFWNNGKKRYHRPVSDRTAISFLAAWQSPLPPPTPEQVRELAV
ncbi:MAG: hypothetical protein JNG88_01280 [Phycisphaerales bacterium]|nr:hypothetical protein [Phycisphaerales bacterium]